MYNIKKQCGVPQNLNLARSQWGCCDKHTWRSKGKRNKKKERKQERKKERK